MDDVSDGERSAKRQRVVGDDGPDGGEPAVEPPAAAGDAAGDALPPPPPDADAARADTPAAAEPAPPPPPPPPLTDAEKRLEREGWLIRAVRAPAHARCRLPAPPPTRSAPPRA
jgi:hypothetical protein